MRLESLEIKGFKSFADHTVINFNEAVIGIVGPNGSGKSNIVDAIRWVLGEQSSKELRLDQMASVIFNGTKKRKPGNAAQVTLTFSNNNKLLPTEYQTVSISRLLYRSGDSEYRLNGVACRLKDITNLFMDTGVGSNSYAIIALNMVDDILADKDNARRKMFEQSAGISKYKARKRETLSKLNSTSEDLDRVEDLLFEINNNLKALEQQARRTKRYSELKEQYKELSLKLAAFKSDQLRATLGDLQSQLQREEDAHRQFEVEQHQLEAHLEALRKSNLDQEKELSAQQREVNEQAGRIRDMESERRVLEQKLVFAKQNTEKAGEQIIQSEQRIRALEVEIAEYAESLSAEKKMEADLENDLLEAEKRLETIREDHGQLKSGLDDIMAAQQQVERALFGLEKNKAVNSNQVESLGQDLVRLTEDLSQRQKEAQEINEHTSALHQQEASQRQRVQALELEEEKRLQKIAKKETEIESISQQIQAIHRELDARRNEYKLTKSMVENLEGFPESIRFLSNSENWNRGAQLLSDIIYVESEYRVAIENFLEPYLNYYVVNNVEEALSAIQLLNAAQKGKANFFLLNAFEQYEPTANLVPSGAVQAVDLIQCDPAYRKLINFLLGHVVVTHHEELAKDLADSNLTVLAKSGRFIRRKFSISGGSIGLFEGKKIGRKKNLEVLEKSIGRNQQESDKLTTQLHQLRNALADLKAARNPAALQQAQEALHQTSREVASLRVRLESFENYAAESNLRRTEMEQRIATLTKNNEEIEKELNAKSEEVERARRQISQTDVSFRQVAEELSQASAAYNDKNISLIRQQNKVNSIQRELSFRENNLDEARSQHSAAQLLLVDSSEEIGLLNDQLELIEKNLLEGYQLRKEKEEQLSEAEQVFFKARGGVHETEDQLRQTNKKAQDLQILINRLKDKLSETRFQLSSLAERLRIEFNLPAETFEGLRLDEEEKAAINDTELQLKVERMKNRLDNYGEINPMAVEAYDEMNIRYDTITEQRDDILKAKEDLLETIREIEETATRQFLDAFGQVRLYFIDVFRSLFSEEDAADLVLLDPDNPLESAIEIVAKPKGKRPQTISQLSGGEKTLTAIALLFSLYLLKPAPFCIFDEVDAPLDDANIEKFNRIIKDFSKESQFVIVTHNKQTMAAVDTIYGIFMQEQGVSAVAQVDFRSLSHDVNLEAVAG